MTGKVYFENSYDHIIGHINDSHTSIRLAVSWLTDRSVFQVLMDKLSQGVKVSLITRNDYLNNHPEALPWNDFIRAGGKLYFCGDGKQLHYKFIVVDSKTVLCTSYNLTCFANGNNRENVMFFEEEDFVEQFLFEFDSFIANISPEEEVVRINKEEVPSAMHGFYETTLANDRLKQTV